MKASVVIPAYNSKERLYNNLLSLNCQDYPKDKYEVIIVDNGSTDETYTLVCGFQAKYKLGCIRLDRNYGRAYARNLGAGEAKGEVLIFRDSDMINAADYVRTHIMEHQSKAEVICGYGWRRIYSYYYKSFSGQQRSEFLEQKTKYRIKGRELLDKEVYKLIDDKEILSGSYINYSFYLTQRQKIVNEMHDYYGSGLIGYCFPWRFFMTNNCSVSREMFLEEGGFDASFKGWGCEDVDLGYRLYRKGTNFRLVSGCVSIHQEHPVDRQDVGTDNIAYFLDKHNSTDLYLFYYGRHFLPDHHMLNKVAKETGIIEKTGKYSAVLNSFLNMLKLLRYDTPFTPKADKPVCDDKIQMQLKQLGEEQDTNNFLCAYNSLATAVYK